MPAMPIRQYLQGHRVDPETARLLGVAFEMALVTLKQRREIDPLRDAVARKIIELAETGERDPERLCDAALKASDGHCPEVGGYGCLRRENATSE
jgi:hypothetical protein